MNGRFFLDTNIFVYSFDASSPKKAAQARKLIRSAIETRGGIVSYQVVQEFFNVALRRFSKPMTGVDAEQYLSTTFRPLLSVHSSQAVYGEALRIGARFQFPCYDSLIMCDLIRFLAYRLLSQLFPRLPATFSGHLRRSMKRFIRKVLLGIHTFG